MAASLSRPVQQRIRQLHEQGLRIGAVARAVGANRNTVARYVARLDAHEEVARSPAADLTAYEVALLRLLAARYSALAGMSSGDILALRRLALTLQQVACTKCKRGTNDLWLRISCDCDRCGRTTVQQHALASVL
ncbi:MAG: hypothetical protein EXR79_15675 [Myxococcales bacterium]|nr:hypothetical protein [Myxococcales bacterium]